MNTYEITLIMPAGLPPLVLLRDGANMAVALEKALHVCTFAPVACMARPVDAETLRKHPAYGVGHRDGYDQAHTELALDDNERNADTIAREQGRG